MKQQRPGTHKIITALIVMAVVILGLFGLGIYQALTKKEKTPQSSVNSPQNEEATDVVATGDSNPEALNPADDEAITELARKQCAEQYGGVWKDWTSPNLLEVTADRTYARGTASCPPANQPRAAADYLYLMAYKKINNTWTLIYRGVYPPCAGWAEQWGAPKSWAIPSEYVGSPGQVVCGK